MRSVLVAVLFMVACGHSDHGYASFQTCYDEHVGPEGLTVQQSIVTCCLEHEIAEVHPPVCGNTAAECEAYLGTNLAASSGTAAERTGACIDYVTQKGL